MSETAPPNGGTVDGTSAQAKKSHHKRRRKAQAPLGEGAKTNGASTTAPSALNGVEIEYVVEKPPGLDSELSDVFDKLSSGGLGGNLETVTATEDGITAQIAIDEILDSLADDLGRESSKKQLKKLLRPTVAQLKQVVARPAVVEVHDITSPDPEMLVFLKSRRAAVNVPRHWPTPNRYLSGKRLSDKKPYQLPDYIAATGIGKLRDATDDTNDPLQKRQRERARPKLGRMEIDYKVLEDAFFKYQTKPRLTRHGELYFEGKEQEKDFSKFIPGVLSEELRQALGMSEEAPPPWLFKMQELGPPPSYPSIKYPGVNAPLPSGATYGTAPGQWGKPPLDQFKRGIWGDVLGTASVAVAEPSKQDKVKLWGDFEREDTEDVEDEDSSRRKRARAAEEEEEEEEETEQIPSHGEKQNFAVPPLHFSQPSRAAVAVPLVPEEEIDLRKKPAQAHRVLQSVQTSTSGSSDVFGASHKYAVNDSGVAVAINPDELETGLDKKGLERLYEEERARTKPALGVAPGAGHVDISEIEKEVLKAKKTSSKSTKDKKKDFKF